MTGNSTANGSSNLEIAQSNQDLIMTKSKRKRRTWIIAGIVLVIVIALVVLGIILLKNEKETIRKHRLQATDALMLEDIILGKLNHKSFNATWVSGNELLYTDANKNLIKLNLQTMNKTVILESDDEILQTAFDFKMSADKKYLLVAFDYIKNYRYSFRAKYALIDLNTGGRNELKAGPNTDLQLVVWAPVGNAIVFVSENDIYYKNSVIQDDPIRLTNGTPVVYNGIPDWVYEEEVFSSNKALWFSPDGKKLSFARFNDTKTPIMVLPIYGEPGNPIFQYPRANFIRYPKAGTPNPEVSLHVIDLENPTNERELVAPTDLLEKDPILSAVQWADNNTLSAIWMNRVQNQASIVTYLTTEPYTTQIVKSLKETSGWLELFTPPIFSKDGSKLALILSHDQGNNLGGYRHVILFNRVQNAQTEPLTNGAFVVKEIVGWDHKKNLIYYLANTANDSAVQHVYSISVDTKHIECLSCDLKSKNGTSCTYNTAEFSEDFSYYVLTCAGPDVPQISIYTQDNKNLLEWENNESLMELVREKRLPYTKKITFDIANGFTAKVSLKLPPNLDTSGNTKYPMLVNVYGGPDSYQVVDRFGIDWGSYLATNKGIIYALIDGRGSGLRGDKLLFAGYRHLGSVEIADQINVTRLIQESLPYVDASRTSIWGWSYGGYASGMALAEDKEGVFKCGISVAPVTDWTLYDSIYTERFMGLPTLEDNLKGYYESQLLTKYEGLRNKLYFLIHGTLDDNVHYQQSMLWSKILEQKDILFRQLSYPDEDHGLLSVRPHLYHSLENFLDECFVENMEKD